MKYPNYQNELLEILKADQQEVRACSKAYRRAPHAADTLNLRDEFIRRGRERANRALEILDEIKTPTIENIGADGSQALSVLALHSTLSVMKRILDAFLKSHRRDPRSVYFEATPSLTDRILIIERKKQRFGTQWMLGADGKFFLPPVEDFKRLNERRAAHGLGKSRHPIDLTNGIPKVEPPRPDTAESDQRLPTDQEYQDFIFGSLD